jgi:hypothetical protein
MQGDAFPAGMNPPLRSSSSPLPSTVGINNLIGYGTCCVCYEKNVGKVRLILSFACTQATFKMTLHVPSDRVALSNMPIAEETQNPSKKMKTIKFEESPRMSTYLVAIVVGELEYIEGHTEDGEAVLEFMIEVCV